MSFRKLWPVACAGVVLLGSSLGRATVVERVVAVVGDEAIWLSELREQARPFLIQILQRSPSQGQKAAAESELYRQMLQRMIDDRLARQVADKHRINVTSDEIDTAIARLASVQGLTLEQLYREVARSGMTAQEYRGEIRRQLLEGKLLELRVKGRVRVTEEAMQEMYEKLQREERKALPYQLQWIVLRVSDSEGPKRTMANQRVTAERIVQAARAGADFNELAREHSDDSATRSKGGDLGRVEPGGMDEAIERVAASLDVGQVSAPFRYADAIVIVRLASRDPSRLGSYQDMREQLGQMVYEEQLKDAKRRWLDSLKRGVHIDVRL